jgi:hypothetical protein
VIEMFSIGDRDDMEFSNPARRFVVAVAAAHAAPFAGRGAGSAGPERVAAFTDAADRRARSIPAGDRSMCGRFRRGCQRHRCGGPLRARVVVVAARRRRFELSRTVDGGTSDNCRGVAGSAYAEANVAVEYLTDHSGVTGTGSDAK